MSRIHSIVVTNTEDTRIGGAPNRQLVLDKVNQIAKLTDTELNLFDFHGEDWARETIMETVKNLKIGAKDSIIFYYFGHGTRIPSMKSRYPAMVLKSHEGLGLAWVHKFLAAKNPRFLLTVSDSCNNEIPEGAISIVKSKWSDKDLAVGYKKLFLDFKGRIAASGCIPGQYSYAYTSSGGMFSNRFMPLIEKYAAMEHMKYLSKKTCWKDLMDEAIKPLNNGVQQPQYEINPEIPEEEAMKSLAPGFFGV